MLIGENVLSVMLGSTSVVEIRRGTTLVWPLDTEVQSCFYNGYWQDEYPWTDEYPWLY